VQISNTISIFGVVLLGGFGLGLTWFALRNGSRKPGQSLGQNRSRDLERLFTEIAKGLRALSSSSRIGGMSLMHERQEEMARLLLELQRRLRMLEDGVREKYEARAHRLLAQAARFGITLPPP
jgi:hypothetical protein